MKKLLLTSALVASMATVAMADGTNFNVGVYGGYAGSASKNTANNPTSTVNKTSELGGSGGTFGLMAAYDYVTSSAFVWGFDIFGSWHNHSAQQDTELGGAALNTKIKLKYSLGTALKFGRMFNKTMGYARLGYINSRFEHSSTLILGFTSTKKKNLSGLLLGLGVDFPMSEKMTFGFSYDFALYQKQKNTYNSLNNPLLIITNSFKPRMHFANVSMKYKF